MTTQKEHRPNLYSGERQFQNFCRMEDFYPTSAWGPAQKPRPLRNGAPAAIPDGYQFEGTVRNTEDLLSTTDTSALLVLQNGEIRHEAYFLSGGARVRWTSWSVAKSFISALVGIALDEGHIKSVDDAISDYFPALRASAYNGVSIRHVLQMSSGVRWKEDYSDPESDVNRLGLVMTGKMTLDEFVIAIAPDKSPGSLCQYNSADTQVLGMLLRGATGRSVTDYMQEKLIEPLGMEDGGYWLTDHEGIEMVLGGLNLTARDYAKLGELYRNGGRCNGTQIVPEAWVAASVQPDGDHVVPGKVIVGGHVFPFGYGYQWWIPADDANTPANTNRGDYSAIGVYNQYIYVDPGSNSVIVKLSANPRYGISELESDNKDEENLAMLRAIADALGRG